MIFKDIAYSGAASGSGVTTELMDSITKDPIVFITFQNHIPFIRIEILEGITIMMKELY